MEHVKLSKHFEDWEFWCKHCGELIEIDQGLLDRLDEIRDKIGKPVNISSGYRCGEHNTSVGGASNSYHMQGKAADIFVRGMKSADLAKIAESVFGPDFGGIKSYPSSRNQFVHVDVRTDGPWRVGF